jgi:hypothetical protein
VPTPPQLEFDVLRRRAVRVERGSVVRLAGHLHVVLGFEPLGGSTAYLQDAGTGEYRSAGLAELTETSSPATTAAAG